MQHTERQSKTKTKKDLHTSSSSLCVSPVFKNSPRLKVARDLAFTFDWEQPAWYGNVILPRAGSLSGSVVRGGSAQLHFKSFRLWLCFLFHHKVFAEETFRGGSTVFLKATAQRISRLWKWKTKRASNKLHTGCFYYDRVCKRLILKKANDEGKISTEIGLVLLNSYLLSKFFFKALFYIVIIKPQFFLQSNYVVIQVWNQPVFSDAKNTVSVCHVGTVWDLCVSVC